MSQYFLNKSASIFDFFFEKLESPSMHKRISSVLVFVFLLTIVLIFLNQNDFLPEFLAYFVPRNIFNSIEIVFTFLLIVEILEMIFILSRSVSSALAKQFEILSLILLRQSFKEFGDFETALDWSNFEPILHIASDAFSALLIFVSVTVFLKIQKNRIITRNGKEQNRYVKIKKLLALSMFFVFIIVGIEKAYEFFILHLEVHFFQNFYNILIFTDILIVLISMRYSYSYSVLFRNSGYALTTVMIRLALSAPIYINGIIGVLAAVFAIFLTIVYNKHTEIIKTNKN